MAVIERVRSCEVPSISKCVPLDDVGRFADAVEAQARRIEGFCDRFFAGPCETAEATERDYPSGYNGQLTRLGTAIDQLVKATARLSEIG